MQRSLRPFTASQPSTSVAVPGLSIPSSSSADSSTLSLEQLPFANENCDTIKYDRMLKKNVDENYQI